MENFSDAMNLSDSAELHTVLYTKGIICNISDTNCALSRDLWIYTAPMILLLGTVGNILIILVMCKKSMRKTAFGLYLLAMATMDLIHIWVGLSRHFIKNYFDLDILLTNVSICRVQRFLVYSSSNASVWLLTAVTLERTLAIYYPTRSMRINTLAKTKAFIVIIIFIQFMWNVHIFFTRGVEFIQKGNITEERRCGYASEQSRWYYEHNVQTILAAIDYSVIPFIAMFSMNIAIFVRLRKRDEQYTDCAVIGNSGGIQEKRRSTNVSHKTLMLLPVTIFFLVATLPHLIFTGVEEVLGTEDVDSSVMKLVDYFVTALTYLNHSANFFLYCLTGDVVIKRLLTCYMASRVLLWLVSYFSDYTRLKELPAIIAVT